MGTTPGYSPNSVDKGEADINERAEAYYSIFFNQGPRMNVSQHPLSPALRLKA